MSHLVASIEFLVRKYIETKFDYDALRHLTPALLETTLRRDEEATEDLSAELLRIVLDEVNWHASCRRSRRISRRRSATTKTTRRIMMRRR